MYLFDMAEVRQHADWKFLTNHGLVLLCIASDPGLRLREIADRVGITERAAHRIVDALVGSGYIERERTGRRNTYEVRTDLTVELPLSRDIQLGELLRIIGGAATA